MQALIVRSLVLLEFPVSIESVPQHFQYSPTQMPRISPLNTLSNLVLAGIFSVMSVRCSIVDSIYFRWHIAINNHFPLQIKILLPHRPL